MTTPDPTMKAITEAVAAGREGQIDSARQRLLSLWGDVGVTGDPLHRCTLAHFLADLHDDPAAALAWDIRAYDAAEAVTDHRVQEHHASLHIAGFYPSLHLNLADGYRRLGAFDLASEHITAAKGHAGALAADEYGDLIRTAITEVETAINQHDTAPRSNAWGPAR
ncbi:hypothetical protein ACHAAC_04445 [Aeromicrobium sp. CF4.19]|uniref:hypothetical protein n=1 Tax=Aeromicrobium sp. CF4.19 TaxID=3373082 RepID=UPI003EE5C35E